MAKQVSSIAKMRNLGPASEKMLNAVGVFNEEDVIAHGPMRVYELVQEAGLKPSKNLLYALYGAVYDLPYQEVARRMKGQ